MSRAKGERGGRSPLRSLFAVLILGTVLPVLGASAAAANTDEPVNTKGEVINPVDLDVKATYPNRGGWSGGNKFVTNPDSVLGTMHTTRSMFSETYVISEPYRTTSGTYMVEAALKGSRVDKDGAGGVAPVRWAAAEVVFYCLSPIPGSTVYTNYFGTVTYSMGPDSWFVPTLTIPFQGCRAGSNLVAVEVYAHTKIVPASGVPLPYDQYGDSLQSNHPSKANPAVRGQEFLSPSWKVLETTRHVWYPGLDIDYTPFDNMLPDYDDGNAGALCVVNPSAVQCDIVNRWKPYEDATSFDKVCAGAPSAEWSSWGWLPEWVGHYALCLFRPAAGFPVDPVKWSVENSSVGDVFQTGSALAASLPKAETCGQLISTTIGGSPFVMDSCTWEEWSQAKTYIGIAAMIFAGIAGFNLIVSAFTSRDMRWDSGGDS